MNLKNFQELNRFRRTVDSKSKQEVGIFEDIKNAESMEIADLSKFGRQFIPVGRIDSDDPKARPVVYDYSEGERQDPKKIAFFPLIDLLQDIVELQDTINIVPDPKVDLMVREYPYRPEICDLINVEVVYGKALKKGRKLLAHLTLAEVVSQLALHYHTSKELLFYVCGPAEECGCLTEVAGYHAYQVAIFEPAWLSPDMIPDITIDGVQF